MFNTSVAASIEIAKPIEEVFGFVSNVEDSANVFDEIKSIGLVEGANDQVGSRWAVQQKQGLFTFKYEFVLSELTAPEVVEYKFTLNGIRMRQVYSLTKSNIGTTLQMSQFTDEFPVWRVGYFIIDRLYSKFAIRRLERYLQTIKDKVEAAA